MEHPTFLLNDFLEHKINNVEGKTIVLLDLLLPQLTDITASDFDIQISVKNSAIGSNNISFIVTPRTETPMSSEGLLGSLRHSSVFKVPYDGSLFLQIIKPKKFAETKLEMVIVCDLY